MLESSQLTDSLGMVVRGKDGKIKDVRFIKNGFEFKPNKLYLSLLNSGRIKPNDWKIPFIFGSWTAIKGN